MTQENKRNFNNMAEQGAPDAATIPEGFKKNRRTPDGKDYVTVEGSQTGIPLDEIEYPKEEATQPAAPAGSTPKPEAAVPVKKPEITVPPVQPGTGPTASAEGKGTSAPTPEEPKTPDENVATPPISPAAPVSPGGNPPGGEPRQTFNPTQPDASPNAPPNPNGQQFPTPAVKSQDEMSLGEIAEARKKKWWGGKVGEEGVNKKGESFVYQPTLKQKAGELLWGKRIEGEEGRKITEAFVNALQVPSKMLGYTLVPDVMLKRMLRKLGVKDWNKKDLLDSAAKEFHLPPSLGGAPKGGPKPPEQSPVSPAPTPATPATAEGNPATEELGERARITRQDAYEAYKEYSQRLSRYKPYREAKKAADKAWEKRGAERRKFVDSGGGDWYGFSITERGKELEAEVDRLDSAAEEAEDKFKATPKGKVLDDKMSKLNEIASIALERWKSTQSATPPQEAAPETPPATGEKLDSEVPLGEEPTETEEEKATEERIKIVKDEIGNSGEVGAESLSNGFGKLKEKLLQERVLGTGKLGNTIEEIKQSANGNEYFVDGKIAYLPAKGEAIFVGDIHGDSGAVESILEQTKFIENMEKGNRDQFLVFLGDYADRGGDEIKTVVEAMKLKDRYFNNVILLRGNHEEKEIGDAYGFKDSLIKKYGDEEGAKLFEKYNTMVEEMPGVVVTGNGVIGVHAGIPNEEINSLKDLNDERRLLQMRWNDPRPGVDERSPSERGGDVQGFGEKPFKRFMEKIGAKVMVRSHEETQNVLFEKKLATIFSNGSKKSRFSHYSRVGNPKFARINLAEPRNEFTEQDFPEVTYEKLKTEVEAGKAEGGAIAGKPQESTATETLDAAVPAGRAPEEELTEVQKAEKAFEDANKIWQDDYDAYGAVLNLNGNESYATAHKNWEEALGARRETLEEGNLTDRQYDATEQGIKVDQLYKILDKISNKLREDFNNSEQGRKLYEKKNASWDIRGKAEKALEQARAKVAPAPAAAPETAGKPQGTA